MPTARQAGGTEELGDAFLKGIGQDSSFFLLIKFFSDLEQSAPRGSPRAAALY